MTPATWAAVITGVGVFTAWIGSALVVSYRIGKIEAELRAAASSAAIATATAIAEMANRLARIEGMFELRLKGDG